jgi:hypothetical protein
VLSEKKQGDRALPGRNWTNWASGADRSWAGWRRNGLERRGPGGRRPAGGAARICWRLEARRPGLVSARCGPDAGAAHHAGASWLACGLEHRSSGARPSGGPWRRRARDPGERPSAEALTRAGWWRPVSLLDAEKTGGGFDAWSMRRRRSMRPGGCLLDAGRKKNGGARRRPAS